MKKYITKIAGTVLTASMIFAASLTASAQGLKISEFMMWVNDLDLTETEILSETDEIYILAVFEETFDGSQPYLELLPGGTTERPQLTFRLDGADRFAEFDSIGELYSQNDTLIFRYTPQPEDYGKGLSLRTSDVPMMGGNARYAIVMPTGLQIGNANIPGSTLPARNQYEHLTAADFNTGGSPLTAQAPEIMINMYKITSPSIPAGLSLMSGTSQSMIVRRVPRGTGNTTSIELEATSDDTSICTVSSSAVIPGGQNEVSFTVTAVAPGTTVINVRSKLYPDEEISIPVRVDLSPSARTVTLVPSELNVGEDPDAIRFVRVQLGSIAPTGAVFNISGYSSKILGDPTVRINPGQNSGQFNIYTPDGRASTILTLTDLAGDYNQAYFDVLVTNEVPVIETPLEGEIVTISVGEEKTFYFSASDKAQTNDSLSYTLDFGHGSGANRTASGSLPWDTPYTGRASGEASHVYDTVGTFNAVLVISDEDGGRSTRPITVIVNPGVRLYVKVMSPGYAGLLGLGDGTIEYIRRTQIWDEEYGNVFSERESIQTRAIPAPGSFGFAWSADEGLSDSDLRMPANTPEELYALIKLEDRDLTVRYMFSREYYPGDGFGDADRDGLGDTWESVYFGYGVSSQVGETPATMRSGDYGELGNPDADYLPAAPLMWVTNKIEGGRVQVFQYPIRDHGGDAWSWSGYRAEPASGNAFNNFREFRGLYEERPGQPIMAYATEYLTDPHDPLRGNSPGTSPALADTDGDGMTDGWEFYFWTTIMYEVNHRNWRAWDPTFQSYDPGDSSTAGIPLLAGPDTVLTGTVDDDTFEVNIDGWFLTSSLIVQFDDGTEYTLADTPRSLLSYDRIAGVVTVTVEDTALVGTDYTLAYNEYGGEYTREELMALFDPMIEGNPKSDIDQDGLYDWEEFLLGTNPLHWDTDGDGMPDGWEVARGLDPLIGGRSGFNANGANGNPDMDVMVGSPNGIKHLNVYIEDYINETYWTGKEALPFNPTLGWNENSLNTSIPAGPHFTNLEEFRVAEYMIQMGVVNAVDKNNWLQYTTDPCDSDTDGDGLPDGWELYVGLDPTPGSGPSLAFNVPELAERSKLARLGFDPDAVPVGMLYGSPFGKEMLPDFPFAIDKFANPTATAFRDADEIVVVDGVTARRRHFPNPRPDWTNKSGACDPWNIDTDGDGLQDVLEYRETVLVDPNLDGSTFVNLNPCSVDTDGDWLPDGWEYSMGLVTTDMSLDSEASTNDVPAGTFIYGGIYDDPDGDGIPNYQEYLTGAVYGWRYDKWYDPADPKYRIPNPDFPQYEEFRMFRPYDPSDFFFPAPRPTALHYGFQALDEAYTTLFGESIPPETDNMTLLAKAYEVLLVDDNDAVAAFAELLQPAEFHYGLQPASWDPAYYAIPQDEILYFYLDSLRGGASLEDMAPFYPTTNPRNIDSDSDGMDDYWEIFHGLNPLFGGLPGSTLRDPVARYGMPLARVSTIEGQDPVPMAMAKWSPASYPEEAVEPTYLFEQVPYDIMKKPWLSGCPFADLDQDGIDNFNESFNMFASDVLSHTDPSPYWMTDTSFVGPNGQSSVVNNYYTTGNMWLNGLWWWPVPMLGRMAVSPAYMFDFELNEGYDTDNDNIPDRIELTADADRGVTDPLDFDSPRSRKAMYLDGNSSCRTRHPYFFDNWTMTSYSVEMWFRAEQPVGRGRQTLIERPVMAPVDPQNPDDGGYAIRRTFRISLTDNGFIRAELDNDALATFSTETTASNGRISPNTWYHLAVIMDSENNLLTIYLNGNKVKSVACGLKPCTGTFSIAGTVNPETGVTSTTYLYMPAPIVVGASDSNPTTSIGDPVEPVFYEYFKGWVDEIRIWDRVRTQAQIQEDMYKRYDKDDVARINDNRFAWEAENLSMATALSRFPQKLLFHYTFDNLPDVIPAPDRDPNAFIPGSDTDEVPFGFDDPRLRRPDSSVYPGIGWWVNSVHRSQVYNKTYLHVPIIENTVAHLRRYPPVDVSTLVPVYNSVYQLLGYRWRRNSDWLTYSLGNVGRLTEDAIPALEQGNEIEVAPDFIPNAANPYGNVYYTAVSASLQRHPDASTSVDDVENYAHVPFFTDMVPLGRAVADIDVEMWDGLGKGADYLALDSDGDGMPDWWEIANGLDPYSAEGDDGKYGDPDGDGLDNYHEYLAGTNPHSSDTNGDGYSDYYSRDNDSSLTYGEMYDDGDGMPNAWEVEHGLNPDRYDAHLDFDNDGWTNYDEYMAGTLPNSAYSYPQPSTSFTFYYDEAYKDVPEEEEKKIHSIILHSYSENTSGITMGGKYDGRLSTHRNVSGDEGAFGDGGRPQGWSFDVSYLAYGNITPQSATLTFTVGDNETVTLPCQLFNEEMGVFEVSPTESIFLLYASGALLTRGDTLKGVTYSASYEYDFVFPVTINNPIVAAGTHLRGGYNRFFGFLDMNGNGIFDEGEPSGLSVNSPVRVSWDSVKADIAVTDKLIGYPRVSWPAGDNTLSDYYDVTIWNGPTLAAELKIEKPRTYIHEGDLIARGIYGLDFGSAAKAEFEYNVYDGAAEVASGSVNFDLGSNATRRKMAVRYPKQLEKVYGNVVTFEWEMDYRNQGAQITIKGKDDGKTYYNKVVPLPVRHGKVLDEVYYYSAAPQLVDSRTFFALPDGRYTYTIKEHVRSTAITAQSITGEFQMAAGDEAAREVFSISGTISYFGKAEQTHVTTDVHTFNGSETVIMATVPASHPNFIAGAVGVQVTDSFGNPIGSMNDSNANGELLSESGTNFISGHVYYDTRTIDITFLEPYAAGYKLQVIDKSFSKPIIVEAFKLADTATSCYGVSGEIYGRLKLYRKGKYTIDGLPAGKYAVRAFLDSNNNGILDVWETSGIADNGAAQGSTIYTSFPPIVVPESKKLKNITLRDKDTDNDLLPDAWEYQHFGNLDKSGYHMNEPDLFIWQEYADGSLDSDPNRIDTDGDGLSDAVEIRLTGTDTHKVDTDGDGLSDLEEFLSGSDPLDPEVAIPYSTLGLEFDEEGNPFVVCPYPALVRGIEISYILKYKQNLSDPVWTAVHEETVKAEDVSLGEKPAGTLIMKPQGLDDWHSGFFKIDVEVDYGDWTF